MLTLHKAAEAGNLAEVQRLLQISEIDALHYEGWSALHYASKNGHVKVVKLLLRSGADPEQPIQFPQWEVEHYPERTEAAPKALHFAVKYGKLDVVKELIDPQWGVDLNSVCTFVFMTEAFIQRSPLVWTCLEKCFFKQGAHLEISATWQCQRGWCSSRSRGRYFS